ncbi:hypothetical protein ScPMuIL_006797 [Solemya velum]
MGPIATIAAFICLLNVYGSHCSTLRFSSTDLNVMIGDISHMDIILNNSLSKPATIIFLYEEGNIKSYKEKDHLISQLSNLTISANNTDPVPFNITPQNAGHLIIGINSSSEELSDLDSAFLRLTIVHSSALDIFNVVIGWIYFVAWSVSFYPQVYINWKRKSVIGLNFDFLAYNLTGFLAYGFFNIGMFWIADVKNAYMSEHPRGINPVQLNDVIFTLHAVFITVVTILQCLIYERGGQKMSKISSVLVAAAWLFAFIALFVAVGKKITWLTYLYYFSYIKLGVTLIKYVPQAYMNYKRKSTEGWSIGNVLLDFTGGSLSLVQMFLLSYNSDDWSSIFGDPTKFGLGFFSILFDVLFIVQHYVLYRNNAPYQNVEEADGPISSYGTIS